MNIKMPKVNIIIVVLGIVGLVFLAPVISTLAYSIFTLIGVLVKLVFSSLQIALVVFALLFANKIAKRYRRNEEEEDESSSASGDPDEDVTIEATVEEDRPGND